MLTKSVCQLCHTTRKALAYYEEKELISPAVLDNGYRDYSSGDIAVIKEISVLRQCGIGIADIKAILGSKNKAAALQKHSYIADVRAQRLTAIRACITNLIQGYDIEREFDDMNRHRESTLTIKEQMALAFPGNYGLFVAMHFGRFLNEAIDTEDKRSAYHQIIEYLDRVPLHIDPELEEFMNTVFSANERIAAALIEQQSHDQMSSVLDDTQGYLDSHHDEIQQYIQFKLSGEFKASPAGRLQEKMLAFQRNSGYQEVLIENMKILSPSYREHLLRIEKANDMLLERFPEAADFY